MDFDLVANLKGLKINEDKEINILLLGQSGIGKSTFVNSVVNYLSFKNFSQAVDKLDKLTVLIPSQFGISNKDNEMEEVTIGGTEADDDDENEHIEIGESATQDVKSYIFPIANGKTKVRLIDSPGIGDSRGLIQDAENIDKILAYIGQLEELHAICLIFNPTNTRITPFFEYCLQEILSRLNKSASRNLIFIFTSTKGTNFSPGDTFPLLRKIRDKIKTKNDVDILLDQDKNVFCFENDAFKYLAAKRRGIEFSKDQRKEYQKSWNQSCKECLRLISYIVGDDKRPPLEPHSTQGTVSINEARRLITSLSQPLADISQLIQDNINVLQRHQHNLSIEEDSINDLKKRLYIPVIDLKVISLTQPVTVCTSSKCTKNIFLEGVKLKHYKQRCHDPCHLKEVPKEIVGDASLVNCKCIDRSTKSCKKCTCDFSIHMHVYYLTKPVNEKKEDKVVKQDILTREEVIRSKNAMITLIQQRRHEFENERLKIVVCAAQFAHFLQHNAITPINDCYETYIKYLIKREEGLGSEAEQETINQLNNMLNRYLETKQAFDKSLELQKQLGGESSASFVDPETIKRSIQTLYQLRHTGAKIKELVEKQTVSRKTEHSFLSKVINIGHLIRLHKTNEMKDDVKAAQNSTGYENKATESKNVVKKVWKNQNYNRGPRDHSNHRSRDQSNHHQFGDQSNYRPRDQSNHRPRDQSDHRPTSQNLQQLNYSPPPPYERVQLQQPPFPPQQPNYSQPHFQPPPGDCCGGSGPGGWCGGNSHIHNQSHQIEVTINQTSANEPHYHQCTNLPQPPQSLPQPGHLGPQGSRDRFGGNHRGGFRRQEWHRQQNRPGFNDQNRWSQRGRPQNKQEDGGAKFNNYQNQNWGSKNNYDNKQDRSKFQSQQKFYNNQNRNQVPKNQRPLDDGQSCPVNQNQQKFNDRRPQNFQKFNNIQNQSEVSQNQPKFKDNENQAGVSQNQQKVNDIRNQSEPSCNQQKFSYGYKNQQKFKDNQDQTGVSQNQQKVSDNQYQSESSGNQKKFNDLRSQNLQKFRDNQDLTGVSGFSQSQQKFNDLRSQNQQKPPENQQTISDDQTQSRISRKTPEYNQDSLRSQNQQKSSNTGNQIGGFVMIDPDYNRGRSAFYNRRIDEGRNQNQVHVSPKKQSNECVIC